MELASAEQVYHVTRISVDSYEDQVPTGWICNPYLEEAVPFHGVVQFLIRMEALLDQLNFPQSFTKNRGMPRSLTTAAPSRGMREGEVETFSLRILFRRNASWQGSLAWDSREEPFRSILELLLLMDTALRETAGDPAPAGTGEAIT